MDATWENMSKEEQKKATVDAYTDGLNEQLKEAIDADIYTQYDRHVSGHNMVTKTTSTITSYHIRPLTEHEMKLLAEGRLNI